MMNIFLLLLLLISLELADHVTGQDPITRPNIWDPLGQSTTTRPRSAGLAPGQRAVRINPGTIIGQEAVVRDLFWTSNRDPRDQQPLDRGPIDRNPLPLKNDVTIVEFKGIPYALPPVDSRRFQPPQKMNQYPGPDGTIQALSYRDACIQDVEARPTLWHDVPYEFETNEDCLYLNVFTPQVSKTSDINYPVMIFFHGGGFQFGSANDWPALVLATKGIVVVTANYRLGPFGFLSLVNNESGNYGLLDQLLVMEWVQDHIYEFSGDPNQVTIAGHGAGAVSVGLHMLSPYSRGLFQGAIAMSGAEVSYHQVITKPGLAFNNTRKLGRQVGCTQSTANEVWSCILTRSSNDIMQGASSRNMIVEYNRYAFLPTVDRRIIPNAPEYLLRNGEVESAVPYLTGVNQRDGTEVLLSDRTLKEIDWKVDEAYTQNRILDYVIKRNYTTNREAVVNGIQSRYTYWPERWSDLENRNQYIQFGSDAYYIAPVSKSARLHSESGSFTWMYVNNYNFSRSSIRQEDRFLPDWMGACHECDLYLLFGFPWLPKERLPLHLRDVRWTESDRNASELFMAHFAQFVKKSQPNLPLETIWYKFAPNGKHFYLNYNYTSRTMLLNDQQFYFGNRADGQQSSPLGGTNANTNTFRELNPGVIDTRLRARQDYQWQLQAARHLIDQGRSLERDYRYENVAFWNNYIDTLANYFTTTLSPGELILRKEVVIFKAITGTTIVLIALLCVLAGVFGYLLFEKHRSRGGDGSPSNSNHYRHPLPYHDVTAATSAAGSGYDNDASYPTNDWPMGAPPKYDRRTNV